MGGAAMQVYGTAGLGDKHGFTTGTSNAVTCPEALSAIMEMTRSPPCLDTTRTANLPDG